MTYNVKKISIKKYRFCALLVPLPALYGLLARCGQKGGRGGSLPLAYRGECEGVKFHIKITYTR
jgi:hypothetical protein